MILTLYTATLPAVLLFLSIVMVVVLSTCDSSSLSSLHDLESAVSELFTIQRFRDSAVPYLTVISDISTAILPVVLFLFLVVVLSTCDAFSLSFSSDLESVELV